MKTKILEPIVEKRPIFNRKEIIYGFIANCSATFTEEFIGDCIGDIVIAISEYEDYIDTLNE
jgi:hypothetical protein